MDTNWLELAENHINMMVLNIFCHKCITKGLMTTLTSGQRS